MTSLPVSDEEQARLPMRPYIMYERWRTDGAEGGASGLRGLWSFTKSNTR